MTEHGESASDDASLGCEAVCSLAGKADDVRQVTCYEARLRTLFFGPVRDLKVSRAKNANTSCEAWTTWSDSLRDST